MGALDRFLKNVFEPRSIGSTVGDPKRIKQRLRLVAGLLMDVPKGKLTQKTLGLLQDAVIDTIQQSPFLREPHGSHLSYQSLGPTKFMIRSENPGHGFLVQFTPFFLGGGHIPPFGASREERRKFLEEHEPGLLTKYLQDLLGDVGDFFHMVQNFPEEVARGLPRFGQETPESFRARRRSERGLPPRPRHTFLEELQEPFLPPHHHD